MRGATLTNKRCSWAGVDGPMLLQYHDREWGVPVHDDRKHFEVLVLSGAQAGLSWSLVLKKREGYRRAFDKFDPEKVAHYSERQVQKLTSDAEISPRISLDRIVLRRQCSLFPNIPRDHFRVAADPAFWLMRPKKNS
jgi:DNA-3-methyladenine glycosylase I